MSKKLAVKWTAPNAFLLADSPQSSMPLVCLAKGIDGMGMLGQLQTLLTGPASSMVGGEQAHLWCGLGIPEVGERLHASAEIELTLTNESYVRLKIRQQGAPGHTLCTT